MCDIGMNELIVRNEKTLKTGDDRGKLTCKK